MVSVSLESGLPGSRAGSGQSAWNVGLLGVRRPLCEEASRVCPQIWRNIGLKVAAQQAVIARPSSETDQIATSAVA